MQQRQAIGITIVGWLIAAAAVTYWRLFHTWHMGELLNFIALDVPLRSGGGQWQDHPAGLPRGRNHGADLLSLAQGVRRAEARPGQATEGIEEGEPQAQASVGRALAGEADP